MRHDLDGDQPAQQKLLAQKHAAHAPFGDRLENFVLLGDKETVIVPFDNPAGLKGRQHSVGNHVAGDVGGSFLGRVAALGCLAIFGEGRTIEQAAFFDQRQKVVRRGGWAHGTADQSNRRRFRLGVQRVALDATYRPKPRWALRSLNRCSGDCPRDRGNRPGECRLELGSC